MPRRSVPQELVLEASITELAPGGHGVAICAIAGERRAVFVRGAAPGDRVRLSVDASHRPARGRVLELLAPGPSRVPAACAHVERCGGCDWMHVDVATQAEAHAAQVRAALPAAWRKTAIATHAAPEPLGYRARARLHVRASGGRAVVGMHEAGTHDPVEVDLCVVLRPALEAARRALPALLEGAHGRGDAQLALGTQGKPVLELRWDGAFAPACLGRIERAVAAREWAGARVVAGEASRPAIIGDPTPWMRGADGEPLRLAPGGFGQASEDANERLATRVAELAGDATRVVELYAGAGNLTVLLARRAEDLVAVESSREGCDAARANLAARGLAARIVEADAATYAWSRATRLLVLDPPRTGARAVALRLAASPVRQVLYVSCDPQTLGRDLAILADAGYVASAVETFEMFPQTSHVEAVILLERARSRETSTDA